MRKTGDVMLGKTAHRPISKVYQQKGAGRKGRKRKTRPFSSGERKGGSVIERSDGVLTGDKRGDGSVF